MFDLYRNVPDTDLVYYGKDEIVWDRINAERLKRGLPGLAAIGIPRPEGEAPGTTGIAAWDDLSTDSPNTATGDQKQALTLLETQRARLTRSASLLEAAKLTNERLLQRQQAALSSVTDPVEKERLQAQIRGIQAAIDGQSQQLSRNTTQLTGLTSQITQSLGAAFPNAPQLASLSSLLSSGSKSLTSSLSSAFGKLTNIPVQIPVNAAQVLKTAAAGTASVKIPGLDPAQITGLLGSAKAAVSSATQSVTGAAAALPGVGKFGISPQQLEQQGLLKPGTTKSFLSTPPEVTDADIEEAQRINDEGGDITAEQVASNRRLNSVLSSPFSWTGKNGVSSLAGFDANDSLQSLTQQNVMKEGLDKLKGLGVVTGSETPEQLGSLVQSASKFGANAVADWSKGLAPPNITNAINGIAKDAQQAVSLVTNQLPSLGAIKKSAEGLTNTVNREKLNAAFASLLGDPKIALPSFGGAAAGVDAALSANTKDEDLTYTGDDYIVWDRINAERVRRGLPGLASLGYPRPPETT